MTKIVKYIGYGVLIVILFILSVDVKKLDEVRATGLNDGEFNAAQYAQNFWDTRLNRSIEESIDLNELIEQLENDFEQTSEMGQMVGISDYRYFLVQDSGIILDVLEDQVVVELESRDIVYLASGFIFGNTVRNALAEIEIGEFVNMTQYNLVSIELNEIVEDRVVKQMVEEAAVGRNLKFVGALTINVQSRDLNSLRIIPLSINYSNM